jgi:hypothetical protein
MSRKQGKLLYGIFARIDRDAATISDQKAEIIEIENHADPENLGEGAGPTYSML